MKTIRNILVVDDCEDDLESMSRFINKIEDPECKYISVVAQNGEQALHIQKHTPLFCAFVDYFMLTHDGLETIRLLHENSPERADGGGKLPVALVSGGWARVEPNTLPRLKDILCISKEEMRNSEEILDHIMSMTKAA